MIAAAVGQPADSPDDAQEQPAIRGFTLGEDDNE